MKFFTWSDFNNARKSFKKILIFELNSLFLVQLTFAFLHPFIDNSRESLAEIKNQEKFISYKNKSLQWLSDNRAWIFLSMNSVHELIAVLFQRGTCIESICLRKENQRYFCQDAKFRSPPRFYTFWTFYTF